MKAFDPQWTAFRNFVKTGIQFAFCTKTTPWFLYLWKKPLCDFDRDRFCFGFQRHNLAVQSFTEAANHTALHSNCGVSALALICQSPWMDPQKSSSTHPRS